MEEAKKRTGSAVRMRSIAFVGLTIALMAVSAWVSIPLGPVPFTLQTFVMVFALLALKPRECVAALAGYLVLGAVGLPVFSSMRGGIGVLAGPTGGFLWGFLLGAAAALLFLQVMKPFLEKRNEGRRSFAIDLAAGVLFLLVSYACGWVQLMAVAALSPAAAFATAIAPFVLLDAVKLVVAVCTARAVRRALH